MRNPLLFSIASSLLLLTACSQESDESNCRYYIQQDLDNQDYDNAIAQLESSSCQDTYPEDEYLVDLASAYLGKSGYSLPTILSAALGDDETASEDTFKSFASDIASLQNDDSYASLQKSGDYFTEYLGMQCADISDPTKTEDGICLIQGVIELTKVALAIDFLSENIEEWISGDSGSESMALSTCALKYSVAYIANPSITVPYDCGAPNSVAVSTAVTFESTDISKTYEYLTVTGSTETAYYLQSYSSGIVFTKDYCETDFTVCTDVNEASCYVCPSQNEEDLSVNDFVLDSLNNGLATIESLVVGIAGDDSDLQDAIDEFKDEIGDCATDTDTDVSADACFTMDDIISYLNDN